MEKNPCGNRVFKTRFPVFTWYFLLRCSSWFFFRGILSSLCLGSSLCFSVGSVGSSSCSFFNFFRSSSCSFFRSSMGSSLRLQFLQNLRSSSGSSDSSSSSMELEFLRLDFHVAKISLYLLLH